MARTKEEVTVGYTETTELTNSTTTNIGFQVLSGKVEIIALLDGVSVTSAMTGWIYEAGEGELDKAVASFSHDVTGVGRVHIRGLSSSPSVVVVDHA